MVLDYIEKLQRKPEHVRRQIAFGLTVTFSAVIVALWVASSPILGNSSGEQGLANAAVELETPFEALRGLFSGAVETVNEAIETGPPGVLEETKSL